MTCRRQALWYAPTSAQLAPPGDLIWLCQHGHRHHCRSSCTVHVQAVGRSSSNDVGFGMPCQVQELGRVVGAHFRCVICGPPLAWSVLANSKAIGLGGGLKALAHGISGCFQCEISAVPGAKHSEQVVVRASCDSIASPVHAAIKLVEDGVVFVQVAEPSAQVFVHVVGGNRSILLVDVPELQRHVVSAEDVASISAECDV
mmetsp:Transcript_16548/g.35803  ORF Transcript_16548/g.35803 Transcript_16548/m.35803 type:complete len:201 (+) Transcript_16548:755-1357(+)